MTEPTNYTSHGKRIRSPLHHKDMFLIDIMGTNLGYCIHSIPEVIKHTNPPDPEKFIDCIVMNRWTGRVTQCTGAHLKDKEWEYYNLVDVDEAKRRAA